MKIFFKNPLPLFRDGVTEWLRCWTANPMCSARMGSNPIFVVFSFFDYYALEAWVIRINDSSDRLYWLISSSSS